ncbi:MAG: FAD:protein FMN transferase [Treponema sp.]|nr:FAD:protein FMN transferase [Treponema sp.]
MAFLFAIVILGCSKTSAPDTFRAEYVLGTLCRIDLFENGSAGLYSMLFTRLSELDRIFSANREDSGLAMISRSAGLEPVRISPELFTVLERSLYYAEVSGGAFDPTLGPLIKLWGIGTENPRIPSDGEIRNTLDLVDWRDLELTGTGGTERTAFLKKQGMSLDLGAIAKGYAADELAGLLQANGIPRALIDLGGNIYVWGKKASGGPWRIGVQDPTDVRGTYAGVLEMKESISVVSAGKYERYFTGIDGNRYHHIMELQETGGNRQGYPVENNLLSVTVIAFSSMDADALSTSCFALGYEKGLDLAKANGAEILFIFENKTIRGSAGALEAFSASGDYRVIY